MFFLALKERVARKEIKRQADAFTLTPQTTVVLIGFTVKRTALFTLYHTVVQSTDTLHAEPADEHARAPAPRIVTMM